MDAFRCRGSIASCRSALRCADRPGHARRGSRAGRRTITYDSSADLERPCARAARRPRWLKIASPERRAGRRASGCAGRGAGERVAGVVLPDGHEAARSTSAARGRARIGSGPAVREVVGVDRLRSSSTRAEARTGTRSSVAGDATSLPFDTPSFDLAGTSACSITCGAGARDRGASPRCSPRCRVLVSTSSPRRPARGVPGRPFERARDPATPGCCQR